ncbi:hypothetical protein CRUP_024068, partial [Coryphaenoides rupestris]
CCLPEPSVVTTVHLRRAAALSSTKDTAPDVYAVLRCEDNALWSRGLLLDTHLGTARLQTANSERGRSHVIDLHHGGQSQRLGSQRGCVYVETSSSE